MVPIFTISASDLASLDDAQARELVARLCRATLRHHGLSTSSVTWGGDQRAVDGGIDVRVKVEPQEGMSGYVPRDSTCFQVKAEKFQPSKIAGEMAPKGKLRPAIGELDACGGAYVIASTKDNCSDSALSDRTNAMASCVLTHGMLSNVLLDFYDSRKLADWANDHAEVKIWLLDVLGTKIECWKPYGPWAYRESSVASEYLIDEMARVFVPDSDSAISVPEAIGRLRTKLRDRKATVRIVGLSGVGKTRLVQSLFDVRTCVSVPALDSENVIYVDLSNAPSPQPTVMLEMLIQAESDCVVVVDNCGQEVHRRLTEIIQGETCKLRLVTIEYDIRDDLPEDTTCFRLGGSSSWVIEQLLRRRFSKLSSLDIDRIVEFSDGNARVAFALASTSTSTGQLARLRDDELFERLFFQKRQHDKELQRCAETASLLYSFDSFDDSEQSELALLSALAEVSVSEFRRNIAELKRRGLIQERGKWKAILPHAIANRLAALGLESASPSTHIGRLISGAPERVAMSFSRRLGYLHESKVAEEMVESMTASDGLLGDPTKFSDLGLKIFANVSPVSQKNALSAVVRAMADFDFRSKRNEFRDDFARLLRSLAYEGKFFGEAASALLDMALTNFEEGKSDAPLESLQSLFRPSFSGTLASPAQRLAMVAPLVASDDPAKLWIALNLVQAALNADNPTSHDSFEFGALKRTFGWRPRSVADFRAWYGPFVDAAVALGKRESQVGTNARQLLGNSIRDLWGDEAINGVIVGAARELLKVDGWPHGWIGARNAFYWEKNRLSEDQSNALRALIAELAPRNLRAEINANVLMRGTFFDGQFDEAEDSDDLQPKGYAAIESELLALGKAAAVDETVFANLDPYLYGQIDSSRPYAFGIGVGSEIANAQTLFDRARDSVLKEPGKQPDLQFLRGVLRGWNGVKPVEVSAFLDHAVCDEVWASWFPSLQTSISLDDSGHQRLLDSLEFGQAASIEYLNLQFGRSTAPLTVSQISAILDRLAKRADGGAKACVDILVMVIHGASEKSAAYRDELQEYVAGVVAKINWSALPLDNHNFIYHLERLVQFALDGKDPYGVAHESLQRMMHYCSPGKLNARYIGQAVKPFFKESPITALDLLYENCGNSGLRRIYSTRTDESVLSVVPADALAAWCEEDAKNRCAFVARECPLFDSEKSTDSGSNVLKSISDSANAIFSVAHDKKEVLKIFFDRISPSHWSGSRAELMRQRLSLFQQFDLQGDHELVQFFNEEKARLLDVISRAENHESSQEREEASRFE